SLLQALKQNALVLSFTIQPVQIILLATVFVVAIMVYRKRYRLEGWMNETTETFRVVAVVSLCFYFTSAVYLVGIDPILNQPPPSPITRANTNNPQPHVFIIILDALTVRDL